MPDWRDAAAYQPLLSADRSLIAWEWLRRDPAYRAAARRAFRTGSECSAGQAVLAPERWGLHAFEDPAFAVPNARPVWRAKHHTFVLGVEAGLPDAANAFELERLAVISTLVTAADGREHLLLCDGFRTIRVDVLAGTIARGAAGLTYRLRGLAAAERPLLTLQRFLALCRAGRFCRSLHPPEARARRWQLMLRAWDAIDAGADQRDIAAELLSPEAAEPRWRTSSPSLRSQAQRLVRSARRMASGAYLELLL